MTYLVPRRSRIIQRKRAMGDDFPNLFDVMSDALEKKAEVGCLNDANASASVRDIDAKVDDLARNWNPTGFYTAADLQTVYSATMDAVTNARAALIGSILSTSDAAQQVKQAQDYLDRSTSRGALYTSAISSANATGVVINAPGLKQWVLDTMVNVGQAFTTVAVLQCRATWLDTAASIISKVWAAVKRVVGVIIKAGETVLKVADDVLDLYGVVKWGALGLGALFVLFQARKIMRS